MIPASIPGSIASSPTSASITSVAAGASERTLSRRLRGVLGKSPLSYFQDLRVERAVHLLRTGSESIDQIAAQVGYADGVTLRALLRRHPETRQLMRHLAFVEQTIETELVEELAFLANYDDTKRSVQAIVDMPEATSSTASPIPARACWPPGASMTSGTTARRSAY